MRLTVLALPAFLLSAGASAAQGCSSVTAGDLTVSYPWARATIGADRPGALYLTIQNNGAEDDTLVAVTTPAAAMAMLHETVVEDGMARMPHVGALPVATGESVALEPGGYHGMLMGLAEALEVGDTFPVTLTFESGAEVTVDVEVLPLPSQGPEC